MEPTTRENPAPDLSRYELVVRFALLFIGLLDEKLLALEQSFDRTRESFALWATTSAVFFLVVGHG